MLTDTAIRKARAHAKPRRLFDGGGLLAAGFLVTDMVYAGNTLTVLNYLDDNASPGTIACQCSFLPLNAEAIHAAKHVFVFRLVGTELQHEGSEQHVATTVIGTIQVVANLRGTTSTKAIAYSTLWCCGSRLDVGKYYAAFISENSEQFFAHGGNLLELGDFYYPESETGKRLRAVVAGQKEFEEVDLESSNDRIEQMPRLPRPCPQAKHNK